MSDQEEPTEVQEIPLKIHELLLRLGLVLRPTGIQPVMHSINLAIPQGHPVPQGLSRITAVTSAGFERVCRAAQVSL